MSSLGEKAKVRKWSPRCAAVMAAVALAGCGSGSSGHPATTRPSPPTSRPGGTTTITTTGSESAAATAVINAWESAEQTLYGYLQVPWQQDRANLVAGETAGTLWPKLAGYFVDPSLQSEQQFLVGVKMGQLNGPVTFNLGHPTVTAITPTSATVAGCIDDTGTTTAAGAPGPTNLDGGGAGGYSGTWNLQLVGGSWKIGSFKTSSVTKC
jgi:hypothetical protein